MIRKAMMVSAMTAAVGVPYALTTPSIRSAITSVVSDTESGDASMHVTATGASGQRSPFDPRGTRQIEGYFARELGEVLQFDASPQWVMARWPRVTAGLAELDLQGYRVPLVTGTAEDDLAGSLTYYFDKEQKIARINFHGSTGDPRKLIGLLASRYKFERQKTDDPSLGLYQVKWNGKPVSELKIRPARVVRADQPHSRFEIELAMKRP